MSGPELGSAERAALEAVDRDRVTDRIRELVRIESVGGREGPAQERVAGWLASDGLAVDRWEIDLEALAAHPAYSAEVERESALGVVGALDGEGEGRTLVLNGHVDVVPAGDPDTWSVPPFGGLVRQGRVYGRGAVDMKGGLVAALEALHAVRGAGARLRGRALLQSVVGEEDGGVGTLASVLRGHRGDGGVVLEPTRLSVVTAQAGSLNFRLTVPGRGAHAALRTEGVSAVEKFEPLHRALRSLERERTARFAGDPRFAEYAVPYPISVGRVDAGSWASSVPDLLVAEGRFGVAVEESVEEAREELEAAVRNAAAADPWLRSHPPRVEWWGGRFEPAEVAADHPLVRELRAAHRALHGEEPEVRGVPYGADMRLLLNPGGTPAVLYGPGDVRLAHGPDEWIAVEDVVRAARVLALLVLRFCGTG